jgi:peptidoglycan/xylan/chitin deacetylase (PgdA/CDA1 family)
MTRIRIATVIALIAAGVFLVGCSKAVSGSPSWNSAPASSASPSAGAGGAGGAGGGSGVDEGTSELVSAKASGTGNVLKATGGSNVMLSFDDGPDPKYTPALLALLRKHQVKAMFCVIGVNVQEHPDLVRAIVADGHTLCNHTWKHDLQLGVKGEATIRADLQKTNDAIAAAAPGAQIKYFRHPGGAWTPTAVKVANQMGMACAGWDVDPLDWNTAKWAAGDTMKQHVLSVLRSEVKAGSIVLSHDGGGDRSGTLAAYEVALSELKAKFTLTPLA